MLANWNEFARLELEKKGLQKLVNLCEKVGMAEEKRGFIQGVLKRFCINFINLLYHEWK